MCFVGITNNYLLYLQDVINK